MPRGLFGGGGSLGLVLLLMLYSEPSALRISSS